MITRLPDLGTGIVYFPGLEALLEGSASLLDLIEIEPQTLWRRRAPGRYEADADTIARVAALPQRKLVHGVGCPVGGSVPHEEAQVVLFVDAVRDFGAPWASEHLSFNRAYGDSGAFNAGFLLPPLQTSEGAEAAAREARALAARLPVPFAVETGVNYLKPRDGELSDGAFVAAVAEGADCGILLDLHNLWANERNGRQPVREFLAEIPLERVWEIHLAGGFPYAGYWLDAHSGAMPDGLADLARELVPLLPNVHAIVFEMLPQFASRLGAEGLRKQLEIARELWGTRSRGLAVTRSRGGASRPRDPETPQLTPREWQDTLGALVIGRQPASSLAQSLRGDPAVDVFRKLVWQARAGMIVDNLPYTCRLLMLARGDEFLRALFDDYFARVAPELFGSAEAGSFAAFLDALELDEPLLADILAFERAAMEVSLEGERRIIRTRHDPSVLMAELNEGRIPAGLAEEELEVVVG
jgi:uncharacterized protein (UPF0276 family)